MSRGVLRPRVGSGVPGVDDLGAFVLGAVGWHRRCVEIAAPGQQLLHLPPARVSGLRHLGPQVGREVVTQQQPHVLFHGGVGEQVDRIADEDALAGADRDRSVGEPRPGVGGRVVARPVRVTRATRGVAVIAGGVDRIAAVVQPAVGDAAQQVERAVRPQAHGAVALPDRDRGGLPPRAGGRFCRRGRRGERTSVPQRHGHRDHDGDRRHRGDRSQPCRPGAAARFGERRRVERREVLAGDPVGEEVGEGALGARLLGELVRHLDAPALSNAAW